MFRFRQFTVHDEGCAMKVGTDGTLLGAWTPVSEDVRRILDAGTGSGLIALMLAQRCPEADVTAIDVDAYAAKQAQENFASSPWSDRLQAQHSSLQETEGCYDLVVSNPPYFTDSLRNPDAARRTARHTDTLSHRELLCHAARLLRAEGVLAIVLPAESEYMILSEAPQYGLTPYKITRVRTKEGKPIKRVLIALKKTSAPTSVEADELCLMGLDGAPRSEAYRTLCKDFYLA